MNFNYVLFSSILLLCIFGQTGFAMNLSLMKSLKKQEAQEALLLSRKELRVKQKLQVRKEKQLLKKLILTLKKESIYDDVVNIISEQASTPAEKIGYNTNFTEDLGMDSLDMVEALMSLEEKFNLDIPDKDAEKLPTVKDVIDYISSHLHHN